MGRPLTRFGSRSREPRGSEQVVDLRRGALELAPQMHRAEGFEREDHRLPTLRVEVWEGFVFACFDAATEALGPRLAPPAAYLDGYHLAELRTTEPVVTEGHPFNWKLNHGFVDASLNPTYRPYFPIIETLSDEQRRRFGFATVLPNLMMGWQSDMVFWFLILAQDLPIAEAMQIGLGSRFAPRGRYSHEEEVLARFNRWLLTRYRRADA